MFSRITSLGATRQLLYNQSRAQFRPTQWMKSQKFNGYTKRLNSTNSKQGPGTIKKEKGIKALVQEYGYSALAVYFLLACVDFPICFVVVHQVGVDEVQKYEEVVKDKIKGWLGYETTKKEPEGETTTEQEIIPEEKKKFWQSPLFTEAIVAYALHKSLIFIRLPITAAITPSFVNLLRRWGFRIGNQRITTIAQQAKLKTSQAVVDKAHAVANNPKFGTRANGKKRWWNFFL